MGEGEARLLIIRKNSFFVAANCRLCGECINMWIALSVSRVSRRAYLLVDFSLGSCARPCMCGAEVRCAQLESIRQYKHIRIRIYETSNEP